MRRTACFLALLTATTLLCGCVERRFVIASDPPGSVVLVNNRPVGPTPADVPFVYYGNYHFTLVRDGYETLQVDQCVPPPWYEYPGLDFFAENLIPWTIRDVRRLNYPMQPIRNPSSNEIRDRAQDLRNRGAALGPLPPSGQ
jgi:hypothetical protein